MPRRPIILTDQFPYHVMNRSNNKEFFYLPLPILWKIFLDEIKYLKTHFKCTPLMLVLMSNHYHLVLKTPLSNLSEAIAQFQSRIAKQSNKYTGRTNHFFGSRYKWCLLETEIYYLNTLRYVAQNPLRAGLSKDISSYEYSSLNQNTKEQFPDKSLGLPFGLNSLDSKWLDLPIPENQEIIIKNALNKCIFKISKDKKGHKIQLPSPISDRNKTGE